MGTDRENMLILAGKKKRSLLKKAIRTDSLRKPISGNTTLTLGSIQILPQIVIIPESPQKISGSYSSSSSLNSNSWDGLVDDYFEEVSNNNAPICQEIASHKS